jgi:hypothetical protein
MEDWRMLANRISTDGTEFQWSAAKVVSSGQELSCVSALTSGPDVPAAETTAHPASSMCLLEPWSI